MAFDVIRRLLAWIDRCDEASQQGLPKPEFKADDGSSIWPPEDSDEAMWWLTDVKRKEKTGDEDGPPDSESSDEASEAQKPHELTSDSDPDSSPRSDMDVPSQSQTVVLPVAADSQRAPFVAWRDA